MSLNSQSRQPQQPTQQQQRLKQRQQHPQQQQQLWQDPTGKRIRGHAATATALQAQPQRRAAAAAVAPLEFNALDLAYIWHSGASYQTQPAAVAVATSSLSLSHAAQPHTSYQRNGALANGSPAPVITAESKPLKHV